MTLLFMDGFDAKDVSGKWLYTADFASPAVTYTATTRFSAGFAASSPDPSGSGQYIRFIQAFTASSQIFLGAAVKPSIRAGQLLSGPFHILLGDTATTAHLYLTSTSLGAVQLWRGDPRVLYTGSSPYAPNGTMLATSANGVIDVAGAVWHYIELGATLNATTGTAVVRVDNTQVISFTGNTKNGGTSSNIDAIQFGSQLAKPSGTFVWLGSAICDDLYICNSAGSANNTFLGDVRAEICLPNGAGSSTQFTPTGSGTNYLNANDVPDVTTTFNSDSVSGHRDTYAMANLVAGTGTVYGVQQVMSAFKTGAGSASLKGAQKSGATVSYGATRVLGTSAASYVDLFETNPATAVAWTASDVNGLEAGAEVV